MARVAWAAVAVVCLALVGQALAVRDIPARGKDGEAGGGGVPVGVRDPRGQQQCGCHGEVR